LRNKRNLNISLLDMSLRLLLVHYMDSLGEKTGFCDYGFLEPGNLRDVQALGG
jgi:hypothetical protein